MDRASVLIIFAEFFLLPIWVGLACRGRTVTLLFRAPAAAVVLTPPIVLLAALAPRIEAASVLAAQVIGVAFSLLIGFFGAAFCPARRPLLAQYVTTLLGWLLLGTVFYVDIFRPFMSSAVQPIAIQVATYANPLLAAGLLLHFDWTHAPVLYRWTGLGEDYRFAPPLWWLAWAIYTAPALVISAIAVLRRR